MNAYIAPRPLEPFEARTIRHLQMCCELAEIGMESARNAAQAARREWDAQPEPAPLPAPRPAQSPRPQTQSDTPRRETASPSLALARTTHAIRQIIELETRIAAAYRVQLDRAAEIASARAYLAAEPKPKPATQPVRPNPRARHEDVPSILANISREIGIDLQDPTLPPRLPSLLRPP